MLDRQIDQENSDKKDFLILVLNCYHYLFLSLLVYV